MQHSFFALMAVRLMRDPRWRALHVRAALAMLLLTAAVLLVGAALVVPAEADAPDANITSFPKAVWWAIETATTVGYGDLYPVSVWGRVIASVMMLVGITTFGMVTAAIATWFVGRARRDAQELGAVARRVGHDGVEKTDAELRSLHRRFDRVEELLDARRGR